MSEFLNKKLTKVGLSSTNQLATQAAGSMGMVGNPFSGLSSMSDYGINTDLMGGNANAARSLGSSDWLSKEGMFGEGGWAMPVAQIGAGALQGFLGLKQLKLAKDMFRQQSEYAATDLANQAKLVNADLESRQNRRMKEGIATMPTEEYMQKYSVSGKVGG